MRINSSQPLRVLPTAYPHTLAIALTERCNYDCFFCTKADTKPAPNLPFEVVEQLLPFIRAAKMVDITGWGEPLLYPEIDKVIDLINANNDKGVISITTNGFLLNEQRAEKLARNLHHLVLSLNAGTAETYERDMKHGKWDRVLGNIEAARRHIPAEKMIFSFVAHRENIREFPAFVRLAHRFGVTNVSLTHMIVVKPSIARRSLWFDKPLANDVIDEATELGRSFGIYVAAPRFAPITTRAPARPPCRSPYDEVFVYLDGKVKPCCFAGSQEMGNINEPGGLDGVWNGERYQHLRQERFFPECKTCFAHASISDLDTHITAWLKTPEERYTGLPRFSILLPVGPETDPQIAADALRTLSWQTYPVWECLVATTAEPEALPAPLRKALERQPKARVVSGATLGEALDQALRAATGQHVAALRAGSRWHPTKLERVLAELERDPGPADGIVHGIMDGTGRLAGRQGCVLRGDAARARPQTALEALLGEAPPAEAFAVAAIDDRLDVHVPGVAEDKREAWLSAVARRLNLIGAATLSAGDGAAALDAFRSALEADPLSAETLHHLAVAAHMARREDEARLYLRKALTLEPGNPELLRTARALFPAASSAA
jgi:MoaA/NifB/PqqE/SkfB family radical SAM enzyme